jgi:PAS domain S-box-containing protein
VFPAAFHRRTYRLLSWPGEPRTLRTLGAKGRALLSEWAADKLLGPSDQRLAAIVEASDDAILSKDLDGVIRSWNPGAERLFGYTAGEIIGRPITILIPPDRQDEEPGILKRVAAGERIDHYETVRRRKDGTLINVSLSVSPVWEDGRVIGAAKIARDITAMKRVEQQQNLLAETNERLAAIVESSDDAILSKDLNGIIQSWNRGAERLFGYSAHEMIGQPVTILIPPERQSEEPGILSRITAGERIDHYETVRRRKDGTMIDISLSVSPVRDAGGRVVGAAKIARDITAVKRAQKQQSLLLREMSHRIKNLFALASGLVTLSARGATSPAELATAVRRRLGALARAHDLTLIDLADADTQLDRTTTLKSLIQTMVLPFLDAGMEDKRLVMTGPEVTIGSNAVTHVALLVNELATNAAKYGALSVPEGRLLIDWTIKDDRLLLGWEERGGPRIERDHEDEGFGSVLARLTVTDQLGGEITRSWKPEGLAVDMSIELARLRS